MHSLPIPLVRHRKRWFLFKLWKSLNLNKYRNIFIFCNLGEMILLKNSGERQRFSCAAVFRVYWPLIVQVVGPHSHAAGRHFEDAALKDGRPEGRPRQTGTGSIKLSFEYGSDLKMKSVVEPARFVAGRSLSSSQATGRRRRRGRRDVTVKELSEINECSW